MKIGIFGGTFDPVHFGHLNLAISLAEVHSLDEVWWIPAQINPLKIKHPLAAIHRLNMLKLALNGLSNFKIMEIETDQDGPSYTINTLLKLKEKAPNDQLHLLLGEDALFHFMQWKEPASIIAIAPPLVASRGSSHFPSIQMPGPILKAFKMGWSPIPFMDISSTDLRKRLIHNKFCGHLLPSKVLDYIREHHLYFKAK